MQRERCGTETQNRLLQGLVYRNHNFWIKTLTPILGDHLLVHLDTNIPKQENKKSVRWDWRKYSKDALSSFLSNNEWRLGVEGVKQYWNILMWWQLDYHKSMVRIMGYYDNSTLAENVTCLSFNLIHYSKLSPLTGFEPGTSPEASHRAIDLPC